MSTKREAYEALDEAVRRVAEFVREENSEDGESPETVVDWVVVVGSQFFADEGETLWCGHHLAEGWLSACIHNSRAVT